MELALMVAVVVLGTVLLMAAASYLLNKLN
jgi:hypothetical protein